MMNENLDETHPTQVGAETQPTPVDFIRQPTEVQPAPKRRRAAWFLWVLLAIAILTGAVAIGGVFGYWQGIAVRQAFESTQVAMAVGDQFALGAQDIEAGRFEVARQRFQYIVELDPDYPGVIEKLTEVELIINATATPTLVPPTPTPTIRVVTPTPDLRGEAELFAQAEDYIRNEQWSEAIETLENLRKKNPEYQAIDIDGMFYLSLRQRGIRKIGRGDLEGGIYDLSLAERFGILDAEADSWRTWAQYYIRGASFWEVDWGQAVYYFEQVAPTFPNMHDGSGWSASQRYLEALIGYAQYLGSIDQWCQAEEQYIKAHEYSGDPTLLETIENVADMCR